ncbi:unnamed protein product [Rhizophagus irregularis]|nr:unnamed protein product [Rhizophagus irregularis]
MQDTENTNEWINWIEEAVDKEHLKFYEYKEFIISNILKIIIIIVSNGIRRRCYLVPYHALHNERIVHRDLQSCNILIRNKHNQISRFWIIKRIGATSNVQSKLFGVWSPPFYVEDEEYDVGLAVEFHKVLEETIVPDTPDEYIKIYTDNRPTIYQVVDWLNAIIITKSDVIVDNHQMSNEQENDFFISTKEIVISSKQENLLTQNSDKMNAKEIDSMTISSKQENLSTEKILTL